MNRLQSEAQRVVAQATEHVGRAQHHADERVSQMQSEAQRLVLENELRTQQTVASTQVSAAQAVASTQVNAVQALHDQDQRLRAEFRERERESALQEEVRQLREQFESINPQSTTIQLRQNDADLQMRVGLMMGQLVALQEHVASLTQRVQTFENWETEGQETYEVEDELVPGAHGDSPPVITFTADQPRLASPLLRNLGSSPR